MGRPPRAAEGGLIYHAMNRANAGVTLFAEDADHEAFLKVLAEAVARHGTRLLAYAVLPDRFHLVLWPHADGELSRFMRWVTLTHTQRWHATHQTTGRGHVYQGRFRAFPVQDDGHLVTICRFVERSGLDAGLATRAEDWPWSSLCQSTARKPLAEGPALAPWPFARPRGWPARVNAALTPAEAEAVARCLRRGQPMGTPEWQSSTAARLGLESTFRPHGRPRKA